MSKETTIKLRLDPRNPPKLTEERRAMLEDLRKKPDSEIDCSDIPEHRFVIQPKEEVAIRLDVDILAWLQTLYGKDYQNMINIILRHKMVADTWHERLAAKSEKSSVK